MKSNEYISQLPKQIRLEASHFMDSLERLGLYYPEKKHSCDELAAAIYAWRCDMHTTRTEIAEAIREGWEGSNDG